MKYSRLKFISASRFALVSAFLVFIFGIERNFAAPQEARRLKIGLALSGGGARGLAHLGVLKALEEMRIPIDAIAGTSMGAFIGALYASGYSINEIEEFFRSTPWEDVLFNDALPRRSLPFERKFDIGRYLFNFEMGLKRGEMVLPQGLSRGHKLSLILKSAFFRVSDRGSFLDLPIPFEAVATDLENAERVILREGDLADAIRASSAFPGLLSPVEINGRLLVDGGSTSNLPVDVVKKMGVDRVIAVDVSSPLFGREGIVSFVDVTDQVINILVQKRTQTSIREADVAIIPELKEEKTFSFKTLDSILALGEKGARAVEKSLKSFSVSQASFDERQKKRLGLKKLEKRDVKSIDFDETKTVSHRILHGRSERFENKALNPQQLEGAMNRIYALGDFEKVDYTFSETDEDEGRLLVRPSEKPWGPHYARFGLSWDGEIKGRKDFNALVYLDFTNLNAVGARFHNELRMGTSLELRSEFFQPLDVWGIFFLAPRFEAARTVDDFYLNKTRIAEYEIDHLAGQIDFGAQLGRFGEVRAGFRRGWVNSDVQLGVATTPEWEKQTAGWVGEVTIDQLDSIYFPTRGYYFSGFSYLSRKELGATNRFQFWNTKGHISVPLPYISLFAAGEAGSKWGKALPDFERVTLGGYQSLSGYRYGELRGQMFVVGRTGFLARIPVPSNVIWDRVFLGAWFEMGDLWEKKSEMKWNDLKKTQTLALGLETKLGSFFLAYGEGGKNHHQFYVSVGRSFGFEKPKYY